MKSEKDAHQGAQVIEETIREIGQRRHTQHRRLCHAARVPRYQYRGDRGGIFCGTAQQSRLVALFLIHLFIDIDIQHDSMHKKARKTS